jgi:beta-lactamase superfamily II metal-dependent hydrolase
MSQVENPFQQRTSTANLGPKLRLDLWDVWQGDASVLEFDDGKLLIIDVGDINSPLPTWLQNRRNTQVYGIVLTHNDADHAGALSAVLDACPGRVENLWLMIDRPPTDHGVKALLLKAFQLRASGSLHIHNLQVITGVTVPLYQSACGRLKLQVVYPDFQIAAANLTLNAPKPNKVSAVICLDIDGKTEVIWAGDAPMNVVNRVCAARSPKIVIGPHHGAPVDRGSSGYKPCFSTPASEAVFVSVGTGNSHSHPTLDFIDNHAEEGRRVVCSELMHCDNDRKRRRDHVMNNHLLLGLLPPLSGKAVTCRGPISITFAAGVLEFDRFHSEHQRQLSFVHQPQCLKRFPARGSVLSPT